ncbi:hypothetical protein, partial [Pediococcus ethanolidurans]|uniref:hypothetical protein n=5 Tax=Pediococcus ethanolidurans TaxID=319653 RepID=UPI0021AA2998
FDRISLSFAHKTRSSLVEILSNRVHTFILSPESIEKGATMRDPSFYMEENKKTHVIRWSRTPFPKSMESSDWVGLDSIDDSSSTSSTSSNNKNDAQADSKADKTKSVTNANPTGTTNKKNVVAKKASKTSTIKSTSNKDISSKSSVLPQTSGKNGSFVSVIVGILLFSVFTLWTFKYELISKHKM